MSSQGIYDEAHHYNSEATLGDGTYGGSRHAKAAGMTSFKGPDVTVSSPGSGVSVENSGSDNSYMDQRTGEMINHDEYLNRSGSSAPTSPEYEGNQSLGHMSKKGALSHVSNQSLVGKTGTKTPIGNTSMGSTMSNVAIAGQGAVAAEGSYDQMGAVGSAAQSMGVPVSPALQSGISEGNEFNKKNNFAPRGSGTK